MIKHVETPFLHIEIKERCEVTGRGNTWQYFLLFAYIVKAAKEGRFTNGFDDEGEEKEFVRILNKVYKCPDDAIDAIEGKVRRRYLRAYVHSPECFECTKVRLGID
jgi:hypothetical protein